MMRSNVLRPGLVALALFASLAPVAAQAEEAIFAGGCFWSMETDLDRVDGVTSTTSGYIGGTLKNPTYQDVITERTGHYEAVKVTYDPAKISYEKLLSAYWHSIDPTDAGGQFCDRGPSYRTAIFPLNDAQRKAAEVSAKDVAADLKQTVATQILPSYIFTVAYRKLDFGYASAVAVALLMLLLLYAVLLFHLRRNLRSTA